MRYSSLSLLRQGLTGHASWPAAWRSPALAPTYDAVIVGGGGHGLAAAYYLAKLHGLKRVAVLERGWLGGGNTGRNTTIVRSNYFFPESVALYDFALRLYEGLSEELNFNIMLSQRGMINLAHSDHDMEMMTRCGERDADQRHRCRAARPDAGARRTAAGEFLARRALSDPRRLSCSGAAASRGTTRWPGAMPVRPTRSASISCRTARFWASSSRTGA